MTIAYPLSPGLVYYVRLRPATTDYTDTGTVTWVSTPRGSGGGGDDPLPNPPPVGWFPTGGGLKVLVSPTVDSTPGWLKVTVSNGNPNDPVNFSVDGSMALSSTTLDDDGQVIGTFIPLPTLTVGSHVAVASTPTDSGIAMFSVLHASAAYPSAPAADVGPVVVWQTGVVKWVLQDPTDGGEQYIFAINPSKMSAPYAARVFTTEHTTAVDGQPLTFEGAVIGVDWSIEGTCRTEAFHDELETFLAIPRRLYLIDHLSRAWTVTLESIAWTRLAEAHNDWAFTYILKAIIYGGPVQL
jgi:hypothetical protein